MSSSSARGTSASAGAGPEALVRSLQSVLARAQSLDTRRYESKAVDAIQETLAPEVLGLLAEARATFAAVAERYEQSGSTSVSTSALDPSADAGFSSHIDTLMEHEGSAQQLVDIAVIAGMELAQRGARLRALLSDASSWDYIALAAGLRRRVLKAASAILQALAEHEAIELPNAWYLTEIERSLQVRRAYASFRARLQVEHPPTMIDMYSRLRLVGTALAMLIGDDIYEHLRIADRRMIRELQAKVIGWLRIDASKSGRFPGRAGTRIWQDIAAFAGLLMQVNNRAELVEHDQALLASVDAGLRASSGDALALRSALTRLGALRGRDPRLDDVLESSRSVSTAGLIDVIASIGISGDGQGRGAQPSW